MSPKVSVVIPAYNNAVLLGETLDGVCGQSFTDREVILIDDGSTDNTAGMVKSYGRDVQYIYQNNQGPAAARNKGASLARGELIAFCDHDDVWNPRHLETMLRCFNGHPAAAMCFGDAEYFGEGVTGGVRHIHPNLRRAMVRKVSLRRLWQCWVASMSVVVVRKSVFEALGGLHPRIRGLDDLHFYLRLAARYEVRYADYVSCRKRLASGNLLPQSALDGLIACLEDLKENHPDVVRAVGPLKLRARLARRYRKLAEGYLRNQQPDLARSMFLKAYNENIFNLYDLWSYLFRARPQKSAFAVW